MATPYLDFLGETSPEEEARIRAEQQAAASTPASRAAQTRAANINAGVSPYDPTLSARAVFGNPVATGQLAARGEADQQAAHNALMQRTGGVLGDTAQIGGYLGTLGPARDVIAEYGGPAAPLALLGPIGAAGALTDAVSPGRKQAPTQLVPSSPYGAGDVFGAPVGPGKASGAVAGAPGAGAPGASSIQPPDTYRGLGVERPDTYRTDDVMGQLRSLFASEQRQGPSEAEALLQQATDRAAGQALGIAAGARGGAGARARARSQALSANAAMGSKASSDLAALRAREDAERRARQAQIMGLLSGAAQGADARDFGYAEADQRARAGADTLDLGYTQARSQADQAAASLANTAYQSDADREMRRAIYNNQQPTGFLDDPAGSIFERLFGGPLRSPARI